MWRAIRWPVAALAVGGALVLLASWLDTGTGLARDAALLVGSAALVIVVPAAAVWLLVTLILYWIGLSRRRG